MKRENELKRMGRDEEIVCTEAQKVVDCCDFSSLVNEERA